MKFFPNFYWYFTVKARSLSELIKARNMLLNGAISGFYPDISEKARTYRLKSLRSYKVKFNSFIGYVKYDMKKQIIVTLMKNE